MSVQVEAYAIITGINLLVALTGASIAIVSHHALAQWRLNKPQQAQQAKP